MQLGNGALPGQYHSLLPQLESLESRAMLFGSLEVVDGFDLDIFFDFPVSVTDINGPGGFVDDPTDEPLPVLPFDHSVTPLKDCPGMPPELCLPGDVDASGKVDFSDFLKLSANVGAKDATWQDGDFSGDGLVSFADFLLLSSNYGNTA